MDYFSQCDFCHFLLKCDKWQIVEEIEIRNNQVLPIFLNIKVITTKTFEFRQEANPQ